MNLIYKYVLDPRADKLEIKGLRSVLSVMEQNNEIVLYAQVDDEENSLATIGYRIYGTGHKIEEKIILYYRFLGTVSLAGGRLMFHVYTSR